GFILGEDGGVSMGRSSEAIAAFRRAMELSEEGARKDPRDAASRNRVGNSGRELGNVLRHTDPQGALEVYDLALHRLGEIPNSVRAQHDQVLVLANSSYALRSLHRLGEAKQRIDASFAILKNLKEYPAEKVSLDSPSCIALSALADHETETGGFQRAIETYEQLLAQVMASKPEPFTDLRDAPHLARLYEVLGALYRHAGDMSKAENMDAKRLEIWQSWDRKLPNNIFIRRQLE